MNKRHPLSFYVERVTGLTEVPCDECGLFDGRVVPLNQHPFIWMSSIMFFPTSVYLFSMRIYDLAFLFGLTGFTSLNYWRNPTLGWRRNMDIIMVVFSISYHTVLAYHSDQWEMYVRFTIAGGVLYIGSLYCMDKSTWVSTWLHMFAQFTANIANICYVCCVANKGHDVL